MIAPVALAAAVTGIWSGTYTLPAGRAAAPLSIQVARGAATVSLGSGHATATVPARLVRGRLRLRLPGRPAPVVLDARVRRRALSGSVRQGALRGSFRAARRRALPLTPFLGDYAAPTGPLALVSIGFGNPPWLLDLDSGDLRMLRGSPPRLAVGSAVKVAAPGNGTLALAPAGFDWTRAGGTVVHADRLPLRRLEVRFPSGAATLAGTLTLPAGAGPFAAVAIVHGSGAFGREGVDVLTSFYASAGVAVLAYDKRGVGQSGGAYPGERASDSTLDVLARDAAAAARYLAAQPEVDPRRVGLSGGSQAGWIIPLAASREPAVRWAVVQVGPTVTVGETDAYAALSAETGSRNQEEILAEVRRAGAGGFDPVPSIRSLSIPVLWLYGALDRTVPTALCVPVLARLRAETGGDFSWVVFPEANHGLLDTPTGYPSAEPASRGLARGLQPAMRAWLRARGLAS